MEPWFDQLVTLHQVYHEGIEATENIDNNAIRANHLLAVLHHSYVQHMLRGAAAEHLVRI